MTSAPSKKTHSVYFENLDAARFFAAFAVFILHFSNELRGLFPELRESFLFKIYYLFASKGELGVSFFFVLSGFLITYLILHERKQYGKFDLGKFLIRRTLRIWPLYFVIGIIGFVLFPLIFNDYFTSHDPLNYFFFLANFDEIWNTSSDGINFLTAPWSVSVEEQFYLFWGVALFLLYEIKQFKLVHLIFLLYLISFYFQWINWADEKIIYYHTLAVCQNILTGALIGLSLFQRKKWLNKVQEISTFWTIVLYLFGIAICLAKNKIFPGELVIFEHFAISLFFGFVILDQIRGKHSFFKFGRVHIFNYLGKISYGIYMYHLVVMYILLYFIPFQNYGVLITTLLLFASSVLLTFFISAISYRYFESKFLSLKPKRTAA